MIECKRCKHCSETKPLGEFYAHPDTKDGRSTNCIECQRKISQQHRAANPEKCREYDRQRAKTEARKAAAKKYHSSPAGRAAAARYRAKKRAEKQ